MQPYFSCRVHLRHRRKQKSHAHSFFETQPGKFDKALFSTYICKRSVTAGKTVPIHDQTLILGGFIVLRSQRRNKQMILTRDISFFILCCCSFPPPSPCGTHKHQSDTHGEKDKGTLQQQPTSLNNKLVVLHVDVTGTDLKMKLRSCCSRWGRLAFKPLRL